MNSDEIVQKLVTPSLDVSQRGQRVRICPYTCSVCAAGTIGSNVAGAVLEGREKIVDYAVTGVARDHRTEVAAVTLPDSVGALPTFDVAA